MIKILVISDVTGWALDNLLQSIIKHNRNRFDFKVCYIHPKYPTDGLFQLQQVLQHSPPDLLHVQYWNSFYQVKNLIPNLNKYPKLLAHHNHYALGEKDWSEFDYVTIPTEWGVKRLKEINAKLKVLKIPYGIDLETFSFIEQRKDDGRTIGYVGRVVPWKNLDKIAKAAKKLNYKVLGYGYIDNLDYWAKIKDKDVIEFKGGMGRENKVSWNAKNKGYEKMTCFVMYSTGERETGTLPMLEACARGVPVLATAQGMAREIIKDGENGLIFNENNFEQKLKQLMSDRKLQERLRQSAWKTIKNLTEQRMARQYAKAYFKVLGRGQPLISVIVPTFNRPDELLKNLISIEIQTYKAKEIIVCDDGSDEEAVEIVVRQCQKLFSTPVVYLKCGEKEKYGLAQARNKGVIEALGDIVLFLDDRLKLKDKNALAFISKHKLKKTWYYGLKESKNGHLSLKNEFIENFSWIRKKDFCFGGMFNEEICWYGGLSEETRKRYAWQGFNFLQMNVVAKELASAEKHKKEDIVKAKELIKKMYEE